MLGALALRRVALPASGLYPIAILALIVASYGAATLARASGFLAVYVSALVLGNARLPHGPAIRGFAEGVAWLAQIGLFVMLGLLASPARLPAQIIPAMVVGLVLVLAGPARRGGSPRRCRCGCPGGSRRSCPGPGCAARSRSCWPRSR